LRRQASEPAEPSTADLLAVGLGNPGAEYTGTRHNCGAEVVSLLAERHGARLKAEKGTNAVTALVRLGQRAVVLAIPQTYMNESGVAVRALCRRYVGGDPARVVVLHDELDLEPGVVRVKQGGGIAGHNGLRSIEQHLHSRDFLRVRIGIGKPPGRTAGADHVLRRPSRNERQALDVAIEQAADALEEILSGGPEAAMNRFNTRS
jgi:PTH1 family peptidyl-tRNA hydrolase